MSDINIDDYKLRYCKHCGGPMLNGKCTKCGKTAFPTKNVIIAILSLICVFLLYSNMILSSEIYSINSEFETRFKEYSNPVTGEAIVDAKSYLDALDAQMSLESDSE